MTRLSVDITIPSAGTERPGRSPFGPAGRPHSAWRQGRGTDPDFDSYATRYEEAVDRSVSFTGPTLPSLPAGKWRFSKRSCFLRSARSR